MIARELEKQLIDAVEQYPVVFVTGPRQSGKSTLLKYLFSGYQYVSLEDLDNREFARNDPRSFLATYNSKTIIDEAQ
ncbi:MAG: AAA family ATPase, partial [Bacteroidales bacterium]|nr:AAA family ATPase [Bacteroidales bacterium]